MPGIDGQPLISGCIPGPSDRPYRPMVRPARLMTDGMLRWRMCEDGPDLCPACESPCEYGKEHLRRQALKRKGRKKHERLLQQSHG